MTSPRDHATLELTDGETRDVALADVVQAAASMDDGRGVSLEALIGNRPIEVFPLLAHILGLDSDMFSRRQVVEWLKQIDLPVVGVVAEPVRNTDTSVGLLPPTAEAPEPPVEITPDFAVQLQRYAGHWVALREGEVVGVQDSLRELIDSVADTDATVVFIPPRSETDLDEE